MTENTENFGFIKLNKFLTEPEKELQIHAQIAKKNLNAMVQKQNILVNSGRAVIDFAAFQRKIYDSCLELKCQNMLNKVADHEKLTEVVSVHQDIKKKENYVKNLEEKLRKLTEEYEKLKTLKEKEDQTDIVAIKAYKKALNFFTKYFNYKIKVASSSEDDICCDITFMFEGQESKYPIRFVFGKEGNCSNFDASTLMSKQQQTLLLECYKKTNNNLALMCTLRDVALKKHTA